MAVWQRFTKTVMWEFVRAVGGWWLAVIFNVLGAFQEVGKRVRPEWDGLMPSEWLFFIGTVLLMFGAYRAYRKVALERDALTPRVDLTVEFEGFPHRGGFGDNNGAVIENVWIYDYTSPDGDRGVLDFELIIEWNGNRWRFDKDPFQQLYRQASTTVQADYFSVPWQIKKNLRRHLVLLDRQPTLIPDQAWFNFALQITDMETGHTFTIQEPGRHRLTWPDHEATNS